MSGGKNFQFMLAGETTFLQLATSGGRGGEGRGKFSASSIFPSALIEPPVQPPPRGKPMNY